MIYIFEKAACDWCFMTGAAQSVCEAQFEVLVFGLQ